MGEYGAPFTLQAPCLRYRAMVEDSICSTRMMYVTYVSTLEVVTSLHRHLVFVILDLVVEGCVLAKNMLPSGCFMNSTIIGY